MLFGEKLVHAINFVPSGVARRLSTHSVVSRMLRPFLNPLLPTRLTLVVVRSGAAKGMRILIDPRTQKFFWTGTWELPVQRALMDFLRPGMAFWDVGANAGFFSLIAARLVGPSGHVHAFEPMPANREVLVSSIEGNALRNVVVHPCAITAASGEATLHAHDSPMMWTLDPKRGRSDGVTVPCRTLDEVQEAIEPPDLIKIDVEGVEVDVLRGGQKLLVRVKPRLLVEFSNDELVAEAQALLPFYRFERIARRHWALLPG